MKTITTILFVFITCLNINAQCSDFIDFQDLNFKKALLQHGKTIPGTRNIDTNNDGEICISEASNYNGSIIVKNQNIVSLEGISHFKNMSDLNCSNNRLTKLDLTFVGDGFIQLNCSNNQLTILHLPSKLDFFADIDCSNNFLTRLDLSNYYRLFYANCSNNNLINLKTGVYESDFFILVATKNPTLSCIKIPESTIDTFTWQYDSQTTYLAPYCTFENTIKLSSYDIKVDNDKAIVSWSTSDNSLIQGFKLQKSVNGKAFETIQEIKSQASFSFKAEAQIFTVEDPISNNNEELTYQLLQINSDNTEVSFGALPSTKDLEKVLPVTLNQYKIDIDNNQNITLNWSTLSEINNSHFNIQKSLDGVTFENIDTIKGQTNSSQEHFYTTIDSESNQLSGTVYYRIEQVDLDGNTTLFDVLNIEINTEENSSFTVYPSPISKGQELHVNGYAINNIDIYNSHGEKVFTQKKNNTNAISIDTQNFLPGIYIVVINNQATQKVIVK